VLRVLVGLELDTEALVDRFFGRLRREPRQLLGVEKRQHWRDQRGRSKGLCGENASVPSMTVALMGIPHGQDRRAPSGPYPAERMSSAS
jgi:hypothetical protein